jgi:hypothetical protein
MVNDKGFQTIYQGDIAADVNIASVVKRIKNKLDKQAKDPKHYDQFAFDGCFNRSLYNKLAIFDITAPYYAEYAAPATPVNEVGATFEDSDTSDAYASYADEAPKF